VTISVLRVSLYKNLGVDVSKRGIESFKAGIDNLAPGSFCVVHQDPGDISMGMVLHTDSAGSKPIQAYLMYKETSDAQWFRGLAQDALAMNINDVICVGASPVSFVDYLAFNTLNIDRIRLLPEISMGFSECKKTLSDGGVPLLFAGGETADLPDLIRTLDVCVTILGRVPLNKIITGDKITPGDVIVGLRSGGKSSIEIKNNSGIMSNGHTLARSCLLSPSYIEKYPELSHPGRIRFTGRFMIDDEPDELDTTIGEALLSPTRLYAPVASAILKKVEVHAMVHNTGGGQTKCLRLGKGIHYIKDDLPDADPIFKLIQNESGADMSEMYQDFNMGVGFEVIVPAESAEEVIYISKRFGVDAQIIGRCEKSVSNSLTIKIGYEKFNYT
jgi:phosphoribosylformylglycinamidine cyclo-ligase